MKRKLCALALFGLLSPLTHAAEVTMSPSGDWGAAFQGESHILNDESASIDGWKLSFSADFTIDQIWNARIISKDGNRYVIGSMDYNAVIQPGEKAQFGFIASPGNSRMPVDIVFEGGQGSLPSPSPSPSPSVSPSPMTSPSPQVSPSPQTSPSPAVSPSPVVSMPPSAAKPGDDWLSVSGNKIVNKEGQIVWLTGANWFGFNTTERVFHGLWSVNLDDTIKAMADRGINLIRVPFSTEIVHEWMTGNAVTPSVNTHANPELVGMDSLEIFDEFLASAKRHGMKVLLDAHSAEADNMGHIAPLWTKGSITEKMFIDTWVWLAERYKNDDTIVAFDLENEPHGKAHSEAVFAKWDNSSDANNWKYIAEKVSKAILAVHPDILLMIEGIEVYPVDGQSWDSKNEDDYHFNWWGGNLRGVADHPVTVAGHQDKIMYSPHDYGPLVHKQNWFYPGFNKDTLIADVWQDNWLYIHQQEISPLLIGEWGGFLDGGDNETWLYAIRELLDEYKMHHTFWCLNPNSGDTGGLLTGDWTTWDEDKYGLLEPVLWQTTGGRYIGLDHEVPLGATGITVKQHYLNGGAEPIGL
ncbi:cellulase family glycosylhydrolase [Agaribacterium haliotis]|uniref:cellulase family glycosylhydrolase n=1 Tax=Agaribacterium haliotis TaxID=2013869 RepID=UPI000BB53FC9|nr:cellulase family glycosylhydrolase [Agaribacterium haliotis]